MAYGIAFLVSLVLFFGFLGLTSIERSRGTRLLPSFRARLDHQAGRATRVLAHVDLSAFAWHLLKDVVSRATHDIAHIILIAVRALERLLTRLVRVLRLRMPDPAVPPEGHRSAFVETITYFKKTLRRSKRPEGKETTPPGVE